MRLIMGFMLASTLLASEAAFADKYQIDAAHSTIEFKLRHLVSKVKGKFDRYQGSFDFDPTKPAEAKFEVNIDASSINTANDERDKHLRGADFFDVGNFKAIVFQSRKVEAAGKDKFKIQGDLTMKGKTCPIVLDAEFGGEVKDPWGNTKAGFEATTRINRLAFDIVWNKALVGDKLPEYTRFKDSCEFNKAMGKDNDGAGLTLGTVIDIELHIEAENLTKKPTSTAPPAAPAKK